MKGRSPAMLLAAALAGCAPVAATQETYVRLHNGTGRPLEAVRVTFTGLPVDYGDLAPGATSDYRRADGAYRYAKVEARIGGEPFTLQPIDFVGETPLGPGRFTYRLEPWPEQRGFVIARATRDD